MVVLINLLTNPSKLKSKLVWLLILKTGGNMLNRILILMALFSFGMSNVFISEAAEGSSNNKYLEIFNGGDSAVDLSSYSLSSCSNGCDTHGEWDYPNNVTFEEGTMVDSGDVYVVCHGSASDEIQAECDQTFTYLSNGDDVFALTDVATGFVFDVIGTTGDDPGSGWQICDIENATKDHTIVRKSWVTEGTSDWGASSGSDGSDCQWVVYDQNEWGFLGFHDMDSSNPINLIEAGMFYYAPETLTIEMGETVEWFNVDGFHDVVAYDGTFEFDACQAPCTIGSYTFTEAGTYDYYCSVGNHEAQGMVGTIVVNGEIQLDCEDEAACNFMEEGECVYPEENYDCDGNCIVDTDCNGECGGDAVVDECGECGGNGSSCAEISNLFFSEWAEGSSNNKYLEIYNAGDEAADLSFYAFPSVGNAPDVEGEYEYWNTFDEGATVAPGDVFVLCHGSADEYILAECDQYHTYLSNGDDGVCLVFGSEEDYEILDCIGNWDGDPGSGWDVAGVEAATKDHTIVRKPSVSDGTDYDWAASAGTNEDDSQWIVREQNNWAGLGFHDFGVVTCDDDTACNYGEEGLCEYAEENYDCDGNCIVEEDCNGECGGDAVIDECGECGGDGSSCGEVSNLFISEAAEGSSNNKYLEIFNASGEDVDLGAYALSSCSNGCDEEGEWDYPNNVTFEPGTMLMAGDVYVVCHGSADEYILAECDQTFTYLSNGDDVFALTYGGTILDIIGTTGDDPGSGWQVCDIENATKDHTLVRKSWVTEGTSDWGASSGSDGSDCQWVVLEQNDWHNLGFHTTDDGGGECELNGDVNSDGILNVLDVVAVVSAITTGNTDELSCADMNGDDIVNVLDIVQIVSIIVGGGRTADASEAIINTNNSMLTISADGYIGGIQMTLSHGNDFSMNLTDHCLVSDYVNHGDHTILVVVEPKSDFIFSSNGEFEISDMIVANSENEIMVTMLDDFSLSPAYPNPFNPSTTFDISIPSSGYLSVKVFNLSGQVVDVIANGFYNENQYSFTWDGSGLPSGLYVIDANFNGMSRTHNVSLIK